MSKLNSKPSDIVVPVLLGPTAVGKTAYALDLAQKNDWDILSCDSRQIYKKMNIGTAKPNHEELERVKHWMIDIKNPDELYSAYEYAHDSLKIIRDCSSMGRTVLICGGTGLYFKALSEGMIPGIETDPSLKEQLMKKGIEYGSGVLHAELSSVDPDASKSIHINDMQRIVRALAVWYQTGIPFSKNRNRGNSPENITFRTIKLTMDRNLIYEKINKRVLDMIDAGLVDECRSLLDDRYNTDAPGLQCVGYRELLPFFDGRIELGAAIEDIQKNSRRYAKRQYTWFTHQTLGIEVESGAPIENLELYYKNFGKQNT